MILDEVLWEAIRPAFGVRYIHASTGLPQVPRYATYGFATGSTARSPASFRVWR